VSSFGCSRGTDSSRAKELAIAPSERGLRAQECRPVVHRRFRRRIRDRQFEQTAARLDPPAHLAIEEELALAKEKTIARVWRTHTWAKNASARRESADGLVKATRASYDAALAASPYTRDFEGDRLKSDKSSLARMRETFQ
jgi:hypothetical protein